MGDFPDLNFLDEIFKSTKKEDVKLREITEFINEYIAECKVVMTEQEKFDSQDQKNRDEAEAEERRRKAKIDDKGIKSRDGSGDEGKSGDDLEKMLGGLIKLLTGILNSQGGGRKQRGGNSVVKAKPIDELMRKEGETIDLLIYLGRYM